MRLSAISLAAALVLLAGCTDGSTTATSAPTSSPTPAASPASTSTPTATTTPLPTETSPTPTVTAGAEDCVESDGRALPAQRPELDDLGEVARAYLADGGDVAGLREALESWDLLGESGGVHDPDMTDGATDEVVVVAVDTAQARVTGAPGVVVVVSCTASEFRVVHDSRSLPANALPFPEEGIPELIALEDLNGDGHDELVYTMETCGAHTCNLAAVVIGRDPASGELEQLLEEPIAEVPSGSVAVGNEDADADQEIAVDIGMIGSVGAGPQRTYRETYDWDGDRFVLAAREITTPRDQWSPIHFVTDGDGAARAGDTDRALELYEELLVDPPAEDPWTSPEQLAQLQTYARYRTMVTLAGAGRTADARAAATIFAEHEPAPAGVPGFLDIGHALWEEFEATQDLDRACEAAVTYAAAHPSSFEVLNSFGYANPQYEPDDLCP